MSGGILGAAISQKTGIPYPPSKQAGVAIRVAVGIVTLISAYLSAAYDGLNEQVQNVE